MLIGLIAVLQSQKISSLMWINGNWKIHRPREKYHSQKNKIGVVNLFLIIKDIYFPALLLLKFDYKKRSLTTGEKFFF